MLIQKKLFIGLFFSFILATVVGTVTHECGHYIAARLMGYNADINYKYAWIKRAGSGDRISTHDWFLFTLGGPLETMLTGTIGVVLLFIYRKRFYYSRTLSAAKWLMVFISLFWLRPTANFVIWLAGYFYRGSFSGRADEIGIARYLALPNWSIMALTALIGAVVLTVITFRFVPSSQRGTFLVAGLLGGVAGYLLWLEWLGKYVMP